jgi:hypothetical protein
VEQTSDVNEESSSIGPLKATPPVSRNRDDADPDDNTLDNIDDAFEGRALSPESALDVVRKRRHERLTGTQTRPTAQPADDATPSLRGALRGATSLPPRQWVKWERPKQGERITADDLEARFDLWAQRKRQQVIERTPGQATSVRRRALCGVLLVAAAVLAIAHNVHTNRHEQAVAANQLRIAELEGAYRDAQPGTGSHRHSRVRAMTQLSAAAAKAGNEVAAAQQRFAQLHYRAGRQGGPGNGAPDQATLDATAHRRSLAKYFDPDSLILPDEQAYSWTTAYELEADQIDPRFEWYIRYEGLKPSTPKVYAWSLEVAMPSLTAPDTARVVWVCREAGGQTVLAWATALYTGSAERFSDLKVVVTADGAARAQSSTRQAVPELGRRKSPAAGGGERR